MDVLTMVQALQSMLVFSGPATPAPQATAEEVEWLVVVLKAHMNDVPKAKGWLTAAQIEKLSGGEKNERDIRKIARAAGHGIVSYPGSPGYKLWSECTVDEISHAISAIDSQIKDMTVRRAMYERAYHAQYRGLS